MKPNRQDSESQQLEAANALFRAVVSLRTPDECRNFFRDLCTPAELQAFVDRWQVVEKVEAVLNKIINQVAKEQSLGLILRKNQTILVATELDITPDVLKRLDTALPSLKVSDPGT